MPRIKIHFPIYRSIPALAMLAYSMSCLLPTNMTAIYSAFKKSYKQRCLFLFNWENAPLLQTFELTMSPPPSLAPVPGSSSSSMVACRGANIIQFVSPVSWCIGSSSMLGILMGSPDRLQSAGVLAAQHSVVLRQVWCHDPWGHSHGHNTSVSSRAGNEGSQRSHNHI